VAAVTGLLKRCQLSIHLVGEAYGGVPDGRSQKSVVVLQNELAAARKLVLDLRANLDPPMRTQVAPLAVMVDPDHPTRQTDEYLEYEVKPPQLFPDLPSFPGTAIRTLPCCIGKRCARG